ncbi:MAG: T9SS type A sorting domain-containing protein [Bacteroidetes bacterium]|nr:T9SS type A sorting domain-containing protein [Bacteroidota bacterium]
MIIDGTLDNYGTIQLEGDWLNNSVHSAYDGSSVEFNGSNVQNVTSGSGVQDDCDYFNVKINNTVTPAASTGVVLLDDMTVDGKLTLSDGTLITGANTLMISGSAYDNVANGGSNPVDYTESWVNGTITRNIATNTNTYDFPVGSDTEGYLAALTNNNMTGTTQIAATFEPGAPANANMGLTSLSEGGTTYQTLHTGGTWDLTPNSQPTGGTTYNLKLYFNDFTGLSDYQFGVVSRADHTDPWSLVGTLEMTTVASGYAGRKTCGSFSKKGIAITAAPLPVELLFFNATCDNGTVLLDWATASEKNNDYFTLYRSADAEAFESFALIDGAGNSDQTLYYNTNDDTPFPGSSYYRLKQTDFDGNYTYFEIIPVECIISLTSDILFNVYPNPVIDAQNLYVSLDGITPQKEVLVVVLDILGKEYYSKVIFTDINGSVLEAMDMHKRLAAGIYMITATSNDVVYKKRVVVK